MEIKQMDIAELENKTLPELRKIAGELNIPDVRLKKKEYLMIAISSQIALNAGKEMGGGILEIMPEGVGFLRSDYQMGKNDIYVSQAQLRRYELRNGDQVFGEIRPPRESERHYGLLKVEDVNGQTPEIAMNRVKFEDLTPIFPDKRYDLETPRNTLSNRLINLIAPIGRGQRGMIVSPPKAGKTTILKEIANALIASRSSFNGQPHRRTPGRSDRYGPLGGRRSDRIHL
jgi:transcription termination factor Rho